MLRPRAECLVGRVLDNEIHPRGGRDSSAHVRTNIKPFADLIKRCADLEKRANDKGKDA